MKRSTLRAAVVAVTLLSLTACSTGNGQTGETGNGTPPSDEAGAGAFPATVQTAFGEVTIEAKPQRIVALGWGDAETVLALGGQPVGASDWLGFGGEGVGPWSEGLYEQSPDLIDTLEPSYEAIAALEPDLILDVKSSGDTERYERLSEITTTVGVPEGGESYLTSVEDQTLMIAQALGVPEDGQALLDEVDERFEAAQDQHPEWDGLTVSAVTRTSEGWGAYIEGGERVQFMQALGFVQNPDIAELDTSASGFSVDISSERLDLLDADLIVAFPIWIETAEITDDPAFNAVPAVQDGRAVIIDGDLSAAYSLGTTAARLYAIDELVPLITDALD